MYVMGRNAHRKTKLLNNIRLALDLYARSRDTGWLCPGPRPRDRDDGRGHRTDRGLYSTRCAYTAHAGSHTRPRPPRRAGHSRPAEWALRALATEQRGVSGTRDRQAAHDRLLSRARARRVGVLRAV